RCLAIYEAEFRFPSEQRFHGDSEADRRSVRDCAFVEARCRTGGHGRLDQRVFRFRECSLEDSANEPASAGRFRAFGLLRESATAVRIARTTHSCLWHSLLAHLYPALEAPGYSQSPALAGFGSGGGRSNIA